MQRMEMELETLLVFALLKPTRSKKCRERDNCCGFIGIFKMVSTLNAEVWNTLAQ